MEKQPFWPLTHETIAVSVAAGLLVFISKGQPAPALLTCLLVIALGLAYETGWGKRIIYAALPRLRRLFLWLRSWFGWAAAAEPEGQLYDVLLGFDRITGQADLEGLADLKNIGVYGATRFGKTTLLHGFIHWLIGHHSPEELKIAISDPKETDYSIYGRLPHLLCPIATDEQETERLVDALAHEMEARILLFKAYSTRHLCNNIERYYQLSGKRLPRIVAIFDELADSVAAGAVEQKLVSLAKKGQAYGITLIVGTQRPSAAVVNGELKSQIATTLCTFMPNAREYGVVAMIPSELYKEMTPTPGLFIVYTPVGQWRFLNNRKIDDKVLEGRANSLARYATPLVWGQPAASRSRNMAMAADAGRKLRGSNAEKDKQVGDWLATLERRPTAEEFMAIWGVTEPTAYKFINRLWKESHQSK